MVTALSDYGRKFQLRLFHYMIVNKKFFFELRDTLKPHFFVDESFQLLLKLLYAHFEKYSTLPDYDMLKVYLANISNENKRDTMSKLLIEISIQEHTDVDQKFTYDTAKMFCRQNEIKDFMIRGVEHWEAEEYDQIEENAMLMIKRINVDMEVHNY